MRDLKIGSIYFINDIITSSLNLATAKLRERKPLGRQQVILKDLD